MAKGMGGMGMPGNMNNLMKQAQKMQKQMEEMQQEMEGRTLEVSSGGGAVKVVITGKKEVKSLTLDRDIVDSEDVEMLQDLIMAAVNEAMRKADISMSESMSKLTGGLNLGF